MAILTKNPLSGAYIVKQGDTLSKIASMQGRTLAELLAANPQYAANPNLIQPGQYVKSGNNTQGITWSGSLGGSLPSFAAPTATPTPTPTPTYTPNPTYNDLIGNTINSSGNIGGAIGGNIRSSSSSSSIPGASFAAALIKILKDAQQRDVTGQARLMKQDQYITGQGISDAARIFKNAEMNPNDATSLGRSATNVFDPLHVSIENQRELATKNMGNINDLVAMAQDAYDKEQTRMSKESSSSSSGGGGTYISTGGGTSRSTPTMSSKDVTALKAALNASKFQGPEADGKYADPNLYLTNYKNWIDNNGSPETFFKNFPPATYINPANTWMPEEIMRFTKASSSGISPDMQALLDSLN